MHWPALVRTGENKVASVLAAERAVDKGRAAKRQTRT